MPRPTDVPVENRLFDVLEQRGIRQQWFAAQLGIPEQRLSRIKRGATVPVGLALRAAQVLGTPVEELFRLAGEAATRDTA